MSRIATFGNDLYTGRRSIDFVGRAKTWYAISAVILVVALLGFVVRGMNLGLEFTGGSEFRVATAGAPSDYTTRATDAVRETAGAGASANVSVIGGSTVRVQTEELTSDEVRAVTEDLAGQFDVQPAEVSASLIGPSWGESVSQQALRALVVFLALTAVLLALYFRAWKMALAALIALAHDMLITVGIYTWSGFEISPATVIGFLTVLGYSLYDTVVVFDKVRENTADAFETRRQTFAEAANLAVNQTLVRSINTTVIAVLPIIAVLVIGFARLGPGTLVDLSLALFVGMTVGAFSSVFIATPLLAQLRSRDRAVVELDEEAARYHERHPAQQSAPATVGAGTGSHAATGSERQSTPTRPREEAPADPDAPQTVTGRTVHKYAQAGPRNQPRRTPRSKR
ncbi:protein translocase subunit SecF [Marihabitans asiaticum]|uniref:Protein-export membrane protein SecF n=1 Tax=Marihabitans asiaticum TaxID=415218 RepID=A0A560W6N9_9MICO|nr:protein translocase subunit SecF [Marihabitans asiaticum]TWD13288.1 protein translocase subunit secF [Marihabitans asiaticum]